MELKDLLKRIIDACNYNEMCPDTDLAIEYLTQITPSLYTKDVAKVTENIILPLMDQYRDSEDKSEMKYIQGTIILINDYLLQKTN